MEHSLAHDCESTSGKVYMIKPANVEINHPSDKIVTMDGSYTDIPLKDNFANGIKVISLPEPNHLDAALREFRRVLTEKGILLIITSTIFLQKKDPMSLTDFIEMKEHKEPPKQTSSKIVASKLRKYFRKVEAAQLLHLNLFIGEKKEK